MLVPKDLNEERRFRANSDRDIILGPYTFRRVVSAQPEVLIGFNRPDEQSVDEDVIKRFDDTILALLEPYAILTNTTERVDTADAWRTMRHQGDANGVVSFADMGEIIQLLLEGVVERPTAQPSDSSDGSTIPGTGTTSMDDSVSPVQHLTLSTPGGPATPPTLPS